MNIRETCKLSSGRLQLWHVNDLFPHNLSMTKVYSMSRQHVQHLQITCSSPRNRSVALRNFVLSKSIWWFGVYFVNSVACPGEFSPNLSRPGEYIFYTPLLSNSAAQLCLGWACQENNTAAPASLGQPYCPVLAWAGPASMNATFSAFSMSYSWLVMHLWIFNLLGQN